MSNEIDYDHCSVCGKELHGLKLNPCYECTYDDPLFWCYKHEHFSHDRVPCLTCFNEKKLKKRKGMPIGL